MRKIVFYIPAILFALLFGGIILIGFPVAPAVWICIVLFIISGLVLAKNKFFGGFFGVVPGIYCIYMSTIDTGQIINIEMPVGIVIIIYFLLCSGYVFYKNKSMTNLTKR